MVAKNAHSRTFVRLLFPFSHFVFRLLSVTLDSAVEEHNGGEKISAVEQCACPNGYSGLSCEVSKNFHLIM
jgi:hypothetical protein